MPDTNILITLRNVDKNTMQPIRCATRPYKLIRKRNQVSDSVTIILTYS